MNFQDRRHLGQSRLLNCTLPRSCFALLTSKLATHYRASQKIVKLARQTVQAEQSGNLCPVADFVHQDMDNNFPWCCSYKIIQYLEILRSIPLLGGERFDGFL